MKKTIKKNDLCNLIKKMITESIDDPSRVDGQIFEIPVDEENGDHEIYYIHYNPKNNTLEAGGTTNTGFHPRGIEVPFDGNLDAALEALYELCVDDAQSNQLSESKNNNKSNMKKKINKSQLKRLVEGVLNELDWKTYMNAADKAYYNDDPEKRRSGDFLDAARDAYHNKYNSEQSSDDHHNLSKGTWYQDDYDDTYTEGWYDDDNDEGVIGRTRTQFTPARYKYGEHYGPEVNSDFSEMGDNDMYMWDRDTSDYPDSDLPDEYKDVRDYNRGKSKYEKGKGWTNESKRHFVNQITETVIKKLTKNTMK